MDILLLGIDVNIKLSLFMIKVYINSKWYLFKVKSLLFICNRMRLSIISSINFYENWGR